MLEFSGAHRIAKLIGDVYDGDRRRGQGDQMRVKCPQCAEQIQSDAHRCRFCGQELSDEERDVMAAEADQIAERVTEAGQAHLANVQAEKARNDNNDKIGVFAFASLVFVVIIIGLISSFENTSPAGNTSPSGAPGVASNYSSADRALLEQSGVSESEANFLEDRICAGGGDCPAEKP